MKFKHIMWIMSALVAVASLAAGIAVFVTRFLAEEDEDNYLECDVDSDEE